MVCGNFKVYFEVDNMLSMVSEDVKFVTILKKKSTILDLQDCSITVPVFTLNIAVMMIIYNMGLKLEGYAATLKLVTC